MKNIIIICDQTDCSFCKGGSWENRCDHPAPELRRAAKGRTCVSKARSFDGTETSEVICIHCANQPRCPIKNLSVRKCESYDTI